MSDSFVTSDLHLNHANVIAYCNRPFSCVEEMNEALIDNWNKLIRPCDTVYIVGDVAMGPYQEIPKLVSRLQGNLVLILGNHDRGKTKLISQYFKEIHHSMEMEFEDKQILVKHHPVPELSAEYAFQICGHVHNLWKFNDKMLNVSVDVWDYKPVLIEEAIDMYLAQRKV